MKYGLAIKEEGALDLVSLGALNHRVDPGVIPFSKARKWSVHPSGGEYNVAANLANCFRLRTGIVSAMVKYPIGDLIAERVQLMGIKPFYKYFEHNGVNGPNMATIYSDRGFGVRAPVVFYNRSNEAGAQLKPGDFDWDTIFSEGVRWFHSGGIFAALSETTGEVIIEGMKAAKANGAVTSFDLNYRATFWKNREQVLHDLFSEIASLSDILVGNEEDFQLCLGIEGPEAGGDDLANKIDRFKGMIERVKQAFPNAGVFATTLRQVVSTNCHLWGAIMAVGDQWHVVEPREITVLDRIGGGDGFVGGLIYAILKGWDPEKWIQFGWASGALATTLYTDYAQPADEEQIWSIWHGNARVQR